MVATTDVILFGNNVAATLNSDVAPGDGSIVLASGQGAQFPAPAAGQYFVLTIQNMQSGLLEICYCTARTGDLLTVERAKEGTSAGTWSAAQSVVHMRLTKGMLEKMLQVRFTGADAGAYLRVAASGLVYPSPAEFQVPAGISYLAANETHTAGKATAPVLITANAGGTVTLNCALSNAFEVMLESSIQLDISNAQGGQTINVLLIQDAVGGRAVTWAAGKWAWPNGSAPTVTTSVNAVDMIAGRYRTSTAKMHSVLTKAFG